MSEQTWCPRCEHFFKEDGLNNCRLSWVCAGDGAERSADEERWRIIEAQARGVSRAREAAIAARDEARRHALDVAIHLVWPRFHKAKGDPDTIKALEAELNDAVDGAREQGKLGRMVATLDHAGNIGVAWKD